jgi:hypothetical protein
MGVLAGRPGENGGGPGEQRLDETVRPCGMAVVIAGALVTACGSKSPDVVRAPTTPLTSSSTAPSRAMLSAISDANGRISARLQVLRGPFGGNNVICSKQQPCLVSVTQASLSPTEEADARIVFAGS